MLLNQDRFEADVLSSTDPVLVDFFATWCGPCKNLGPVVEKLAGEGHRVCKVDIEVRPDLASRYGVTALPTLVVITDGEETARFVGLQSERTLKAALNQAQAAA
jgi:thioredoxin 1